MSDPLAVFQRARKALDEAGLRHALVGASALGRFTLPRATLDMDFLVEDPGRPLDQVLRGLSLIEHTHDAFFDQDAFIFEVPSRVTPIEMFVATHWLTRDALAHVERVALPPYGEVPVLRLEDTLLLKAALATHPARPKFKRDLDAADARSLAQGATIEDAARLSESARRLGPDVEALLRACGVDMG